MMANRQYTMRFAKSEKGLVTIEWIAIAAAAFLATIAITAVLLGSLDGLTAAIGSNLSEEEAETE